MYDIRFPNLGIVLKNIKDGFTIFGFEIKFYGVIIALGFVLAFLAISKEAKRGHISGLHALADHPGNPRCAVILYYI